MRWIDDAVRWGSLWTLVLLASCTCSSQGEAERAEGSSGTEGSASSVRAAPDPPEGKAEALFAGGCFWCMEKPFERLDGVASVLSGYAGGEVRSPTYEQVSSGETDHAEAVRVVYDPDLVSYEDLLEVFWHNIDPVDADGQFCDRGRQYRTALFPRTPEERKAVKESIARIEERLGEPVVTGIEQAATFWIAEDEHQDYYRTHPDRYRTYRANCGRDERLRELWGADAP